MVRTVAEVAFGSYCETIYAKLYLYFQPAVNGRWGKLAVCIEHLPGWRLAENLHLPRDLTLDQLTRWIQERTDRLPLIGDDGVVEDLSHA